MTVPDIDQYVYQAHDLDKPEMVGRLLQGNQTTKVMIFCRTKRAAQRLTDELVDRGFAAAAIHGDLNQEARERSLKKFRANTISVLVATDVAARGIDIVGVSHVINYECPDTDATYVHRIGRTGRAGNSGVAVTFVDWADLHRWKLINQSLNLELAEPAETYSSSPHFYTDLDIPEGTKGRMPGHVASRAKAVDARHSPAEGPKHRSRRSTEPAGDHPAQDKHAEAERKPRRRRRRTRGGVEVAAETPAAE